jgi:hypothetical protein
MEHQSGIGLSLEDAIDIQVFSERVRGWDLETCQKGLVELITLMYLKDNYYQYVFTHIFNQ